MPNITRPKSVRPNLPAHAEPRPVGTTVDCCRDSVPFPRPLQASDLETIDALRDVLDKAEFSEEGVRKVFSDKGKRLELKRIDYPLYERKLAEPRPLHTLIRLFMMRQRVDEPSAAAALSPLPLPRLLELGILEYGFGGIGSKCTLAICNGLVIAHDRVMSEGEDPQRDHVLGVNASAHTLASVTSRRKVSRTLDVGAGSGIQSFLAAWHSDEIIATDTNPRALDYLAFNARLNRIHNVECRQGSLFDPVEGCRFGLIVCNPPYVISPESTFTFRDSGMPGDSVCEHVVRRAPAFLEEEGFACILCNWAHRKDQDWSQPIRRWAGTNGCDTLVLRGGVEDPLSYAAAWNRTRGRDLYAKALDAWQDYYRRAGIEAISMGAVILRRRTSDGNWFRAEDWPAKPDGSCSEHILRVFSGQTLCNALSDEELLEQTFALDHEHRLQQQLKCQHGEWKPEVRRLELQTGLGYEFNLDGHSLCLVSQFDGRHTVAEAIEELSSYSGAQIEQLRPRALAIVRLLVSCGFLVPALAGLTLAQTRRVADTETDVRVGHGVAPEP